MALYHSSEGGRHECAHEEEVLLALDCAAGGIQYRMYCLRCWRASLAIQHAVVRDMGRDIPMADPVVIQGAREAYWRSLREECHDV